MRDDASVGEVRVRFVVVCDCVLFVCVVCVGRCFVCTVCIMCHCVVVTSVCLLVSFMAFRGEGSIPSGAPSATNRL